MSELIGKWLLGTDLPDPTLPAGSAYSPPTYTAVAGPLYGSTGSASIEDICQGADGDCELLSGLADDIVNHPQLLSSMIVAKGNGTYGVRFYVNGNEIWETVNDELPTASGELVNAHNFNSQNSALWVALIEKAYAQLSATGLIDHPAVNSYNNISAVASTISCWKISTHAAGRGLPKLGDSTCTVVFPSRQDDSFNDLSSPHWP